MNQKLVIGIVSFLLIDLMLGALLAFDIHFDTAQAIQITHIPLSPEQAIAPKTTFRIANKVELKKTERLKSGRSVKSVVFSPDKKFLYSLNLEGGSVYEFNQQSREISRKLIFKQTQAKGYDYDKHKWMNNSFEEKPVEGHFTHNGKYLWISLHNAEGIVAWNVQEKELISGKPFRIATIEEGKKKTKVNLHFFKTGKTPKVITSTKDGKYLFVSNWHSNTVSILDISNSDPSEWKKVKDVKVSPTPRGMCMSKDDKVLYIGLMGSDFLYSVSVDSLKIIKKHLVGHNPRHLLDTDQSIYISLSKTEKLVKLSQSGLKELKRSSTKDDPRTISLSPDKSLLFATCYSDNTLQIFDAHNLQLLLSVPCKGKPVGVDVFQKGDLVEAWVGNYISSTVNIFSFKVDYQKNQRPNIASLTSLQ